MENTVGYPSVSLSLTLGRNE